MTSPPLGRFPVRWVSIMMVASWAVMMFQIHRPWVGTHDWNGVAWSSAARLLNHRSVSETRFGVSLHHGAMPIPQQSFYVHHPPMVVWLMTLAYRLFGESEAIGRAVPIVASLVGIWLLARIAHRLGGSKASVVAALVYAALPLSLYYGRMPNHEPIGLTFLLAATWQTILWRDQPTMVRGTIISGLVFLACLTCWPAYFFALTLGLIGWNSVDRRALFFWVGIPSTLALIFLIVHIQMVREDGLQDLLAALVQRSNAVPWFDWFPRMAWWLIRMLSPVGTLIAIAHVFRLLRLPPGAEQVLLPMVVTGWANLIIFRQGAFVHEYYTYYLGAPSALLAGYFLTHHRWNTVLIPMAVVIAVAHGVGVTRDLHAHQLQCYASDVPEPENFVVDLGKALAQRTQGSDTILSDIVPSGEQLGYYSDRKIVYLQQYFENELAQLVRQSTVFAFTTRFEKHRQLLHRVCQMAGDRIRGRTEFQLGDFPFEIVRLEPRLD